jgi:hypothetical protein
MYETFKKDFSSLRTCTRASKEIFQAFGHVRDLQKSFSKPPDMYGALKENASVTPDMYGGLKEDASVTPDMSATLEGSASGSEDNSLPLPVNKIKIWKNNSSKNSLKEH